MLLDQLMEKILELSQTEGAKPTLQMALKNIRQLIQEYQSQSLIAFIRKTATRLSSPIFDDELSLLISAAQDDMARQGVGETLVKESEKPLVKLAITTYCKAHFGLDNPDSEKYLRSYQSITNELRNSRGYAGGETDNAEP